MRQQVAQAADQFFEGESCGSRTGREFSGHLVELTFALGRSSFRFLVTNECPSALMGFEQAPEFQLAVGAHHRVGVDGEVDRELTNRRKLGASFKRSGGNSGSDLIDKLAVHGHACVQIEREFEAAVVGDLSHKC